MNRRHPVVVFLQINVAIILFALGMVSLHHYLMEPEGHSTRVWFRSQLLSSQPASILVQIRDINSHQSFPKAKVRLVLSTANDQKYSLAQGVTDSQGYCQMEVSLKSISLGNYQLVVYSKVGDEREESKTLPVKINQPHQIYLTTDRTLYQPGETVHIRTLVQHKYGAFPLREKPVILKILDGNKKLMWEKRGVSSSYGGFHGDWNMDKETPPGRYQVLSQVDNKQTVRDITIRKFVLPQFKSSLRLSKAFAKPGEVVKGTVKARYFFGRPIQQGKVAIKVIAGKTSLKTLSGQTDGKGVYRFQFSVPTEGREPGYLIKKLTSLTVQARVIDRAKMEAEVEQTLKISPETLVVNVVPESSRLKWGMDNFVLVQTLYPSGLPASVELRVGKKSYVTNPDGLARIPLDSSEKLWKLVVLDKQAQKTVVEKNWKFHRENLFQLTTVRRQVMGGEKIPFVFASPKFRGPVQLELVVKDTAVKSRAMQIQADKTAQAIVLPRDCLGVVHLNIRSLATDDKRVLASLPLWVESSKKLLVQTRLDKKSYRPGGKAQLQVLVTNGQGKPVEAALAVVGIDRRLNHISGKPMVLPGGKLSPAQEKRRELAARWMLANLAPPVNKHLINFDSGQAKIAAIRIQQTKFFNGLRKLGAQVWSVVYYLLAIASLFWLISWLTLMLTSGLEDITSESYMGNFFLVLLVVSLALYISVTLAGSLDDFSSVVANWGLKFILHVNMVLCVAFYYRGYIREDQWAKDSFLVFYHSPKIVTAENFNAAGVVVVLLLAAMGIAMMFGGKGLARYRVATERMTEAQYVPKYLNRKGSYGSSSQKGTALPTKVTVETLTPATYGPQAYLRKNFNPTFCWNPEVITKNGKATLDISLADSITTYDMKAEAISHQGEQGTSLFSLQVFQPFFVELDLPQRFTHGDRVTASVALYNYLSTSQKIRLSLKPQPGLQIVGPREQQVTLASGQVSRASFTLVMSKPGRHSLEIHARGTKFSDALVKSVEVMPRGYLWEKHTGGVTEDKFVGQLKPNPNAMPGTSKTTLKVYPGKLTIILEGLEGMLAQPHGCFEQTSSANYPNLLVLKYLKSKGKKSSAAYRRALKLAESGYQRILSFQNADGGFSLYPRSDSEVRLSALALYQLSLSRTLIEVNPQVIKNTRKFLNRSQHQWSENGSLTAYVATALSRTGYHDQSLWRARKYLSRHAHSSNDNAYYHALMANALVGEPEYVKEYKQAVKKCSQILRGKSPTKNRETIWGGRLRYHRLSTVALLTYARMQGKYQLDRAAKALGWIWKQKGGYGWGTTENTVLALQCLTYLPSRKTAARQGKLQFYFNHHSVLDLDLAKGKTHQVQVRSVSEKLWQKENHFRWQIKNAPLLQYHISQRCYLPPTLRPASTTKLTIENRYEKLILRPGQTTIANAIIANSGSMARPAVMAIIPLPPGMVLNKSDVGKWKENGLVRRVEVSPHQIVVYLDRFSPNHMLRLSYRLRAKDPLRVSIPPARIYEYYTPSAQSQTEWRWLEVAKK